MSANKRLGTTASATWNATATADDLRVGVSQLFLQPDSDQSVIGSGVVCVRRRAREADGEPRWAGTAGTTAAST